MHDISAEIKKKYTALNELSDFDEYFEYGD